MAALAVAARRGRRRRRGICIVVLVLVEWWFGGWWEVDGVGKWAVGSIERFLYYSCVFVARMHDI